MEESATALDACTGNPHVERSHFGDRDDVSAELEDPERIAEDNTVEEALEAFKEFPSIF